MAFRVRVLHFIVLGLLGMSLVIYSSFYATAGPTSQYSEEMNHVHIAALTHLTTSAHQLDESSQENQAKQANISQVPSKQNDELHQLPSLAMLSVKQVPLVESKANISSSSSTASTTVIQPIHPEVASNVQKIATLSNDSTEKGVTTRFIYQSGYVINNSALCPDNGTNLRLIILITSAPNHHAARMAIRQTWGHYNQRKDVSIGFFLGTTHDEKVHQAINQEYTLYGDIIYANFIDTYNNLTLKTISMLEWVDTYCNRTNFLMKTDDDMFINVPVLLRFIEKHLKYKKVIFGRLAKKWKPIRVKKSKYYVSPLQYRPSVFPNFTTGPAYLMSGDSVRELYSMALDKTYLKLEDVYVTGIVAQEVKIKRIHAAEFFNKRITFNPCSIQKGISIHMIKFHEQFDLWKKLLDGRTKCP